MRRYLDLLRVLTYRNIQSRYRGSVLGVYWSLLNPLSITAVYTLVFGSAFVRYYQGSLLRYAIDVFVSLVVVNYFAGSTAQALPTVVANAQLLNKIRLPMELFPASMIAAWSFQLSVGILPVLAVLTVFETHELWRIVLIPVPLFSLALLCMGLAFGISAIYVFFRDIPYMYEIATFITWVTTPVFYPAAIVPVSVRRYLEFNPIYPIIQSLREIVAGDAPIDALLIGRGLAGGILALMLGIVFFRALRPRFMDLI